MNWELNEGLNWFTFSASRLQTFVRRRSLKFSLSSFSSRAFGLKALHNPQQNGRSLSKSSAIDYTSSISFSLKLTWFEFITFSPRASCQRPAESICLSICLNSFCFIHFSWKLCKKKTISAVDEVLAIFPSQKRNSSRANFLGSFHSTLKKSSPIHRLFLSEPNSSDNESNFQPFEMIPEVNLTIIQSIWRIHRLEEEIVWGFTFDVIRIWIFVANDSHLGDTNIAKERSGNISKLSNGAAPVWAKLSGFLIFPILTISHPFKGVFLTKLL